MRSHDVRVRLDHHATRNRLRSGVVGWFNRRSRQVQEAPMRRSSMSQQPEKNIQFKDMKLHACVKPGHSGARRRR